MSETAERFKPEWQDDYEGYVASLDYVPDGFDAEVHRDGFAAGWTLGQEALTECLNEEGHVCANHPIHAQAKIIRQRMEIEDLKTALSATAQPAADQAPCMCRDGSSACGACLAAGAQQAAAEAPDARDAEIAALRMKVEGQDLLLRAYRLGTRAPERAFTLLKRADAALASAPAPREGDAPGS